MDALSEDSMGSSDEMPPPTKNMKKSTGGISEDDMTEDEVAVMVKNALRKARRAMHNSSPLNTPDASNDDDDDEWSEPEYFTPTRKKMDSSENQTVKNITPTRETTSGVADIQIDEDDDLAKRIEAEINSARAFAEHAYFGKEATEKSKEEQPPASPANAPSVTSDVTEIHANKTTSAAQKSLSSPQGYSSTLSPRARRKAARKSSSTTSSQNITPPPRQVSTNNAVLDSPLVDTDVSDTTASPNKLSRNHSFRYRKNLNNSAKLSPPRNNEENTSMDDILMPTSPARDDIASDYYKSPDEAEKRRTKQEAEAMITEKMIHEPSVPVDDKLKSPKSQKSSRSSSAPDNKGLSVNSSILNSKVNTYSNSNLTKQQLNGSRQVIFRHPYPLPPPPVAFRSEDIIINENTVPDKSFNVKLVEPDAELEQLIQQSRDESNIVRRSNACGAIKVLASRGSNKAKLARTTGLLDALVYASEDNAVDSDALDARTRAVTALLYLSEPKDNRIIVAKHPGVLEVLVKVIEEDTGEARLRACSTLATLAKTAQNRSVICNSENLAMVLSNLMILKATKKVEEKEEPAAMEETVESKSGESQDEGTTQEGGSFSNTFSGMSSETDGTGSYTEDDTYTNSYGMSQDDRSAYSNGMSMSNDRSMSNGGSLSNDMSISNDKTMSTEEGSAANQIERSESIGEEEGVEMQMSSLKKLNIENASNFLERSQLSACATLTHLTKHCANARGLCLNEKVLNNILFLAEILEHPLHTRCLEMLCNFTRFPSNNAKLASMPRVIEILTAGGKSKLAEDRLWSIRTIQNLCSDASSKVGLATGSLLSLLSACAMRKDYEEQLAAVGALMNLATEPGSIVPLTNTKTVVATLVHLAHSPNTPAPVRKIACDSLATIGLWLQTLASAGTVPDSCPLSPLPTHTATGWLRWD